MFCVYEAASRIFSSTRLALLRSQPIVHWGYIPAVIIVGMLFTKPQPSIGQLFFLA
jgi:hypothetical protein